MAMEQKKIHYKPLRLLCVAQPSVSLRPSATMPSSQPRTGSEGRIVSCYDANEGQVAACFFGAR